MSIFAEIRTRKADASAEYDRLVRTIANGEHVDPEAVLVVLERSGCDAEQLEKDAAALEARIVAARTLEQLPAAEDERRRLKETQAKVANDFDAIRRKHENAMRRIDDDLAVVADKMRDVSSARRLLLQTASPAAKANLAEAQGAISGVLQRQRAAEAARIKAVADLAEAQENKRRTIRLDGERGDPLGAKVVALEARVAELTADLQRLGVELSEARAKAEEAEAALLVP